MYYEWFLITLRDKIMPTGVLTSYKVNGNLYGSYILGDNITAIRTAIKKRGLGEKMDSVIMDIEPTFPDYGKMSLKEIKNKIPEIIHSTCFLSQIAINSNNIKVADVIGDEGILHLLSHSINSSNKKKSLTCIRDLIRDLRTKAIGCYEPV